MNGGYNLLAFPHGGYLIREKREGWTQKRTMDPLRPSMRGEVKSWEDALTKIERWEMKKVCSIDNSCTVLVQNITDHLLMGGVYRSSLRPPPHMRHVLYLLLKIWMIRWFKVDHSGQWERQPRAARGYCQPEIYTQAFEVNVSQHTAGNRNQFSLKDRKQQYIDPPCASVQYLQPKKLGWQDLVKLLAVTASDSFLYIFFNVRGVGVCLGGARPAISLWLFARKWIIIHPEMLKWTQKGRGREVKKRWAIQWQKRESENDEEKRGWSERRAGIAL